MVRGQITTVAPDKIRPGDPMKIYISYEAEADVGWFPWGTKLTAISGNLKDSDTTTHFGTGGNEERKPLNLGTMPDYAVQIDIILEGDAGMTGGWQTVDRKSVIIKTGEYQQIDPEPIAVDLPDQNPENYPDYVAGKDPGYTFTQVDGSATPQPQALDDILGNKWLLIGGAVLIGAVLLLPKGKSARK